jgi:hypothetical protein
MTSPSTAEELKNTRLHLSSDRFTWFSLDR